jgi:outer membrane lipoprotein-sorting protein
MFSLIISIIAIALVAALAAASVFYGGNAFKQGTAKADVSEFQNKGQQIAGAFTLAKADGYDPTSVAELTDGSLGGNIYLTQVPSVRIRS